MVNMLKMFLHKDVATKFTAVKKIRDKFTMKNTNFYSYIEGNCIITFQVNNIKT